MKITKGDLQSFAVGVTPPTLGAMFGIAAGEPYWGLVPGATLSLLASIGFLPNPIGAPVIISSRTRRGIVAGALASSVLAAGIIEAAELYFK